MYYISPVQWFLHATLGTVLHNLPVQCAQDELAIFNPPSGQTCAQYAATFLETAVGYLDNPDATSNCGYCQFSVGDDYLSSIHITYGFRYKALG